MKTKTLSESAKFASRSVSSMEIEHRYSEMPSIYSGNDLENLRRGLIELVHEIEVHGNANKVRFLTRLEESLQVLEIAWNGPQLSEDVLGRMNSLYKRGVSDKEAYWAHGTRRAGYYLARVGGTIRAENFEDGDYRVRNLVEIPNNLPRSD